MKINENNALLFLKSVVYCKHDKGKYDEKSDILRHGWSPS